VIYFGIMINLSTDHTSDFFPSVHVTSSCVTSGRPHRVIERG